MLLWKPGVVDLTLIDVESGRNGTEVQGQEEGVVMGEGGVGQCYGGMLWRPLQSGIRPQVGYFYLSHTPRNLIGYLGRRVAAFSSARSESAESCYLHTYIPTPRSADIARHVNVTPSISVHIKGTWRPRLTTPLTTSRDSTEEVLGGA